MVYITGDIHGRTEPLHDLMTRFQPTEDDIVVLLGDVGINYTGEVRDRLMKQELSRMKPTFFCIHGNHENRPQNIGSYQEKAWHGGRVLYEENFPKILFPVDGDIFDIEGKQCIVIGGAYSVDKFFRLQMGYKWWEDEQPSPTIKEYVEQQVRTHQIDVVFSHTCPFRYIPIECCPVSTNRPWTTARNIGWIPSRRCSFTRHGIWGIGISINVLTRCIF